jgi:protein-S-isoprenylcysteine O-methyltransferase Ste14
MTALKTIIFILFVPGILLGIIPPLGIQPLGGPALTLGLGRWLAVPFWVAGSAILVWCARDFVVRGGGTPAPVEPPKALVINGMYRFVRNPMYVGVLSVQAGTILWYGSLAQVGYWFLLFTCVSLFVQLYEEPHLRKTFEAAYEDYCRKVPRWVPRLRS